MLPLKTPDVTLAQLLALLTFVCGQLVAYGVLTQTGSQLAVSIGSTVLAAAWKVADAVIRHGRATGAGSGGTA